MGGAKARRGHGDTLAASKTGIAPRVCADPLTWNVGAAVARNVCAGSFR